MTGEKWAQSQKDKFEIQSRLGFTISSISLTFVFLVAYFPYEKR